MSYLLKSSLLALTGLSLLASEASAQYYNPNSNYNTAPQAYNNPYGGGGLDLGLREGGFNPHFGLGVGQVGAGLGTGFGRNGIGSRANVGLGRLGTSVDGGLGRNGLGVRSSSGFGNTGAAFNAGLSHGGLGAGTSTKLFGFGPGASIGIGKNGPGLGASMAFGPLGTLLIGSHTNTYPGAQQTATHMYPDQNASYYTPQSYGHPTNYQTQPVQRLQYQQPHYRHVAESRCDSGWTC